MEPIKIDLGNYKNTQSTIFTGRPQGMSVRDKIDLNRIDKDKSIVEFLIPDGTTSFNPSFYLGLLFKSYETLGVNKFDEKYKFCIETSDEDTNNVLLKNLEDGRRYAVNSLDPKSVSNIFSK